MKSENMLLYKTSRGFTRFIKSVFSKRIVIDHYKNDEAINFKEREYLMAFIQIESMKDLAGFASVYSNVERVYVISNLRKIDELLLDFDDVIILQNELLKEDIIRLIESNMEMMVKSN